MLLLAGGGCRESGSAEVPAPPDGPDVFPRITDSELLDLVQRRTFAYFWEFGHPVSGMARERNTSGDLVTTGGTGFGLMALPVAIERDFISRSQGRDRALVIVRFLQTKTTRYHGAFAHWVNGETGETIPFSVQDDGADLVETSLLVQGLLTIRQYFNGASPEEKELRERINTLWEEVEWTWFQRESTEALYWHWSPQYGWDLNLPIRGWNEALITYVLAASSPTYPITRLVYENGWTAGSTFLNGKSYYGEVLPLGEAYGGPLFLSQYAFTGLNPHLLTDSYTHYFDQNRAHTLINYAYCKTNPFKKKGYSEQCWGLTACDVPGGYNANSPTNDKGVIAPTAALSAFPYTPEESMQALHYFYYKLGDQLWQLYGFVDSFSPEAGWVADSFLSIDQGPIILMIENYRTGLLWDLFMSSPEISKGLTDLGFQPVSNNTRNL